MLGCGGEMKNTFCLLKGNQAVLSQHIGDLENNENLQHYRQSLAGLKRLLGVKPQIIGYDLHPHYLVSKTAREMPGTHIGVQHHHAHLASCLAENGFSGEAVGIILDGTGYGSDGNLWGFEILTGDCRSFRRHCHLAYMPLPGGEKAVRSPWVMASACLIYFCGERGRRSAWKLFPEKRAQIELLHRMLRGRNLSIPLSSGCGRLRRCRNTGILFSVNCSWSGYGSWQPGLPACSGDRPCLWRCAAPTPMTFPVPAYAASCGKA